MKSNNITDDNIHLKHGADAYIKPRKKCGLRWPGKDFNLICYITHIWYLYCKIPSSRVDHDRDKTRHAGDTTVACIKIY